MGIYHSLYLTLHFLPVKNVALVTQNVIFSTILFYPCFLFNKFVLSGGLIQVRQLLSNFLVTCICGYALHTIYSNASSGCQTHWTPKTTHRHFKEPYIRNKMSFQIQSHIIRRIGWIDIYFLVVFHTTISQCWLCAGTIEQSRRRSLLSLDTLRVQLQKGGSSENLDRQQNELTHTDNASDSKSVGSKKTIVKQKQPRMLIVRCRCGVEIPNHNSRILSSRSARRNCNHIVACEFVQCDSVSALLSWCVREFPSTKRHTDIAG